MTSTEVRGFSLVELLCVMALVVTLAALALPAATALLQRVHRSEARLALLQVHDAQQRHLAQHHRYASLLGEGPQAQALGLPARSASGRYMLQLQVPAEGEGYRIEARPTLQGSQASDRGCALLWLDDLGRQGSEGSPPTDCWR